MKLRVRVTADHIRNGRRTECRVCPIALAIHDADPRFPNALVGGRSVKLNGRDVLLPLVARRFIFHFDCCDPVSPFEFVISKWPDRVIAS